MAPLAQTLALLAMTVATVAIEVVPLDMAQNSFDDQYLKCSVNMTKIRELMNSELIKNGNFSNIWAHAMARWQEWGSVSSPLTPEQAIAIMAYTMSSALYDRFNTAVREGGSSSRKYRDKFHFKSLHFLLTRAVQTLRQHDCRDVFWGVRRYQFKVKEGDQVRFGQFVFMLLSEMLAWDDGVDTMFKVHTCHGVDIQKFSYHNDEKKVLIPPFETFRVTAVRKEGDTMHIELCSTGTFSNYNCERLKGGSLPRNSPNLCGLLLVTVAVAAVSGTL